MAGPSAILLDNLGQVVEAVVWSEKLKVPVEAVPAIRPLDHLALFGADDAPAILLRSEVISYRDLRHRIGLLAGWLKHRIPQPGTRVATWMAKGELACLMPLAAARAGLIHVPINPLLKHGQVAHILADSGAAMLIGASARLSTLEPGNVSNYCSLVSETDVMTEAAKFNAVLPPSSADTEELAAILYTSGSTGRPKGVMLSHANLWLGAESVAKYLGLQPDDRTLAVLPLSFDYGQNQLLSSWFAGACVAPLDYLTPRDLVKAVERHGITTLAAVPPLWVQLTELDWPTETAGKLRRLTNSGGALTPDLVSRLRALFPQAQLFAMYGLTEAFRSTFLNPALIDSHPTSMGKAIPHAEILVIGENGEVTADGEEGELVHCGPLVAQGYWHDADRTAERFRPAPKASRYGGTAVWSGDRVRRDAEGLLYFVGRRDAMIKSAGNRISPQEIEEVALATGLVAEAVALGIPDEKLGQAVHLVVRGTSGRPDVAEGFRRTLMQELPNFMMPKFIHWREALPIGPNGKIDRTRLASELAQ
jgi:acyl-CoA ligase (AMP-forming) (exosortase A-associated)